MIDEIKKMTSLFFINLGVEIDDLIIENKEKNIFLIKIKTPESGLLIGPNGKNLDNITNILKLILKKNTNEQFKIHLEINDYIKTKDDRLKSLIYSKISFVEKKGVDLKLPFYGAYDRKKIHSIVAEYGNDRICTKSIGEGNERRLYICKKSEKLTIDLDGNDI